MMINQQTERIATRNRVLRVSFVCLLILSTAWLSYRWNETDTHAEYSKDDADIGLPDNYFGAIRVFENSRMPQIVVQTLDAFDIPPDTRSIAIMKDGSIAKLDNEKEIQFTRPFGWFLPNMIGVTIYREGSVGVYKGIFATNDGIKLSAKYTNELINTPIPKTFDIGYTTNELSYMRTGIFQIDDEKLIITESASGEPATGIVYPLAASLNPIEVKKTLEDGSVSIELERPTEDELVNNQYIEEIIAGKKVSAIGLKHPVYTIAQDDINGEHFYFATSRDIIEQILLSTTAWPNTFCGKKISFAINLRNRKEKSLSDFNSIYLVRTKNTWELCKN